MLLGKTLPMIETAVRRDRRHGRRDETLREIVDVAVAVMAEHGAAGLSLGEVARRVGIQTPSLYGYFASKNAVYDAVFARGWSELREVLRGQREQVGSATDLVPYLLELGNAFVRWAVEHSAYSQLMFWRPVPGYEPSAESYAPAVEALGEARTIVATLQSAGLLDAQVDTDRLLALWTVLISGVVTQQLANAPHETYAEGTFAALVPDLVAMFVTQYGHAGVRTSMS
jgi:AcrR family transcriptional regulator